MTSSKRRNIGPDIELALLGFGATAAVTGLVTWAGARLAVLISGGEVSGGFGEWLATAAHLASDPSDPPAAWGQHASNLPGTSVYWACTGVAALTAAAVIVVAARLWRRFSFSQRQRFGTRSDAHVATRRDVEPLVVASSIPPVGRLLLGRLAPKGPLLATEDRHRHPMAGRSAKRQGDRGSVALIGPTRSGKTVLASAGIVTWKGPVIALSIKRDLYDTTASARARQGEIAVFDPSAVTGLRSGRWSPLRDVTTATAALRVGRALAQAIPRTGMQGGDFWAKHGEAFCSAYISLAGLSQLLPREDGKARQPLTVDTLAFWAHMHVGILDPTVNELVRVGLGEKQPLEVRLLARHALTHLMALHREDPRIRGSIFATARLAFEAWLEPAVAHSASPDPRWRYDSPPEERWEHRPRWIDLEWLMGEKDDGRGNTLYLCAPDTEFARLTPVLGGLLGDLREQVHTWDVRGQRLEKPLLVVIDEAGQLELQWLPAAVSTLAGLGVVLVTCWQSRAQIKDRYGTLSDAVVSGHRSKVFFSGLDDPASVDYVTKVAGTERVAELTRSADLGGSWRNISEHMERHDLVPAHVVRQIPGQEAVLFHGTLPPVHLRTVRWWEDRELKPLVPADSDGRPVPPGNVRTCPLTDEPAPDPERSDGSTSIQHAAAHLPVLKEGQGAPRPGAPASNLPGHGPAKQGRSGRDPSPEPPIAVQTTLPLDIVGSEPDGRREDADVKHPAQEMLRSPNRVAGYCERCMAWVEIGEGHSLRLGRRDVLHCYPACPLERPATRPPRPPTPATRGSGTR